MAGGEVSGDQESTTVCFRFHQKIGQFPIRIATDMNEDTGAAIKKLPDHLKPDATTGAGDHDIAIFE